MLWAVYSIETRRVIMTALVSSSEVTGWALIFGSAMLLAVAVVTSDFGQQIGRMRAFDVAAILYMGVCGTVLAFLFWSRGIKSIGPARASIFINLVPIWGTVMSAVIMHSWPSSTTFAAIVLAMTGIITMQSSRR
jgi:drug/metabolite transporter (DMT)-like permease